jgi:GrpB-like predicted nucleotidyltransferase (UPF0157 family)
VLGLAAKDVIDVQVSIANAAELDDTAGMLEETGWMRVPGITGDHPVPGRDGPGGTGRKVLLREPAASRRVNLHVRAMGKSNQRYPLVVRDYLRAHPDSAQSYATLKRDLALLTGTDTGRYADVKDAACDLIYFAAEDWATSIDWVAGASDA